MTEVDCDVCVVGGGPAGALAAYRLAKFGRRVCLVEQENFPRPHVGESLSAGALPLLTSLDLGPVIFDAAFSTPGETLLCWNEPEPRRVASSARGKGRLVDRGIFDALLLEAAKNAGVHVIQPARAEAARVAEGWQVKAGGMAQISARWLIDAAGRRGCIPARRIPFSPVTTGVWGHLACRMGRETRVEAMPEGWVWAAPLEENRLSVVMVADPTSIRNGGTGNAAELLRERLRRTVLFHECADAPWVREPVVCDATCASAEQPIGPAFVKVGEAAYSLDPLSSTGLEKALQTGSHGALVAHTLLDHPERMPHCVHFYSERLRETIDGHKAWASQFHGEVQRFADEPFWAARTAAPPFAPTSTAKPREDREPRLDASVLLAPGASIVHEPCIVGDKIEVRAGVRSLALDRPLVYLDGFEIVSLLAGLSAGVTWGELLARWSRSMTGPRAGRLAAHLWRMRVLGDPGDGAPPKPANSIEHEMLEFTTHASA